MSESTIVNISGINKERLLRALWKNSKPSDFYVHSGRTPPTYATPTEYQYFDYHRGRAIKADLGTNNVKVSMYDQYNGDGAFARIVAELREELVSSDEEED